MPKRTPDATDAPTAIPLPSFHEFRASVKYVLTHDHGMPDLVAEQVLNFDADFVEERRQKFSKSRTTVAEAADDLVTEPPTGIKWVAVKPGMRVAEKEQVVLNAGGAISTYLNSLVALGLHGQDRDAVANAMLAKGIESVFPLIASQAHREKPG